jgi:MazG family protein
MFDKKTKIDPGITQPIARLQWIMETLRAKDGGCPWDLKQNHFTLKPYLMEEACEVIDAIDDEDDNELCKELGDLLLQIVFHAQIASERNAFTLDDTARTIGDKLVLRHPHVFGDTKVSSAKEVLENWEAIKLEKENKKNVLSGVPKSLSALLTAYRIQEKVSSVGFDWETPEETIPKVYEEVNEFIEAVKAGNFEHGEEEFGDLLFSLVNLARHSGINCEFALKKSNDKFINRFTQMEELIKKDGNEVHKLGLKKLDKYWDKVKTTETSD